MNHEPWKNHEKRAQFLTLHVTTGTAAFTALFCRFVIENTLRENEKYKNVSSNKLNLSRGLSFKSPLHATFFSQLRHLRIIISQANFPPLHCKNKLNLAKDEMEGENINVV